MQKLAYRFDELVERLESEENKLSVVLEMITIVRSVEDVTNAPIVEMVKKVIENEQADSVSEIAEKVGVSRFYLQHVFKKNTGTTITEYKNSVRLTKAKLLLVTTDESITDIALKCGFETSSYFSEVFKASEQISPSKYRELLKK
jgi:AraC-like DNA-binding protein